MENDFEINTVGDLFSVIKEQLECSEAKIEYGKIFEIMTLNLLAIELKKRTGLHYVYSEYMEGKMKHPVYDISVPPADVHPDAKNNLTLAVVKKIKPEKEQLIIRFSDMNCRDYSRPPFLYNADSKIAQIAGRIKSSYNYFIRRIDF